MAIQIQLRQGTTTEHNTFTGAVGEVTVDTDKKTLVVHDGTTVGGTPLLKASQLVDASETVKGVAEIATQTEVNAATDDLRIITPKKLLAGLKNHLNASGNAPIYACRAWVNFDGTGIPSIMSSGNVSSITDNGTGDYTINFTTAMQDANYAISGNATQNSGNQSSSANILSLKNVTNGVLANKSTTSFTIVTVDNSADAYFDSNNVSVAVFR